MKKFSLLLILMFFLVACEATPKTKDNSMVETSESEIRRIVFEDAGVKEGEAENFTIKQGDTDIKVSFTVGPKDYLYTLSHSGEIWELNIKVKH